MKTFRVGSYSIGMLLKSIGVEDATVVISKLSYVKYQLNLHTIFTTSYFFLWEQLYGAILLRI